MVRKVVVVTPVYNRKELTLQCLRSLTRINRTGLEVKVIVVDDASTDGTVDAVRKSFPETEVIQGGGNLWYTAGTNLGIERALQHNPDYVLCCNDDSIFEENTVRRLVECAELHPRSVVGPLLLLWNEPHRIFQVSPQWDLWYGGFRHWRNQTVWTVPSDPWNVEVIVGNCVLYPTAAIREVGLMDEKHLVQYGDAEYTPRMRRNGWRLLIEPRARIFCKPNDERPRIRKMPFRKMMAALFDRSGNPHSLVRRYYAALGGAPNKALGLAALVVFFVRVLLRKNVEGEWADRQLEKPLSEVFAKAVIPRQIAAESPVSRSR